MLPLLLVIVASYLVGSVPTSLIVSKFAKGIDIRKFGSGNAGGTNVARLLGWRAGLAVILIDGMKGYAATQLIPKMMYGPMPFENLTPFEDFTVIQIIAGCAAILGHIWTAFGKFRGGKGIATASGVLASMATIELLVGLGVFMIVLIVWRYISLSSITGMLAVPVAMFARHNIFHAELTGYHTLIFFSIGISLLLVYTHRENVKRLIAGTERPFSRRTRPARTPAAR